jgi:hypothetical protein
MIDCTYCDRSHNEGQCLLRVAQMLVVADIRLMRTLSEWEKDKVRDYQDLNPSLVVEST